MSKLTYKVSYYVLYAIFAVTLVILVMFYAGGQMDTPVVPEASNPAYTDALIYLIYGLFGVAVLVTILGFIAQFFAALKDNPVNALKSLTGLILIVVMVVVTWSLGSDEPLEMAGYEGTDNVPFWLKLTDMFLYSLYFLIAACILAMVGSSIKRALS